MIGLWILLVGNLVLVPFNVLLQFSCRRLLRDVRAHNKQNHELVAYVDEQTERIRAYNAALKQVHGP